MANLGWARKNFGSRTAYGWSPPQNFGSRTAYEEHVVHRERESLREEHPVAAPPDSGSGSQWRQWLVPRWLILTLMAKILVTQDFFHEWVFTRIPDKVLIFRIIIHYLIVLLISHILYSKLIEIYVFCHIKCTLF